MRLRVHAAAAAMIAVLLCLTIAAATAAAKRSFVYVHQNGDPNEVRGFELAKDGTLTALPGSPFVATDGSSSCGGYCMTMAYSKKRKALVHSSSAGLTVWLVGKDGALVEVAGSPFGGRRVLGCAVVERGKKVFVYGSAINDDQIVGYSMEKDGTLSTLPGFPIAAGGDPDGMDAAKGRLFVANEDSTLSAYVVNKGGSLSEAPGSPWAVPASFIYNVQAGPRGKFVYVGDDDPQVFAFAVNKKTAELTPLAGSPFAAGVSVSTGLSIHKKRIAYTFSNGDEGGVEDVRAFKVEKDGTLTALGDLISSGIAGSSAHAFTSNGKLLVVANDNEEMASFRVDRKTGVLTPADSVTLTDATSVNDLEIVVR